MVHTASVALCTAVALGLASLAAAPPAAPTIEIAPGVREPALTLSFSRSHGRSAVPVL